MITSGFANISSHLNYNMQLMLLQFSFIQPLCYMFDKKSTQLHKSAKWALSVNTAYILMNTVHLHDTIHDMCTNINLWWKISTKIILQAFAIHSRTTSMEKGLRCFICVIFVWNLYQDKRFGMVNKTYITRLYWS